MSITTDRLQQLGISIDEAREFLVKNTELPDEIYRISQENGITTEMLAEIMGNGTKADDIQFFMQSNGFNTQILDLSTEEYLADIGIDFDDMRANIIDKVQSPEAIFALSTQYALTPKMLAEIVGEGFKPHDIVGFFEDKGFTEELLDSVSQRSHNDFIPFKIFDGNPPPLDFFPPDEFIPLDEFMLSEKFIDPTSAETAVHFLHQDLSLNEMKEFLANNPDSPDEFFRISQENNMTTDMLAEIMGGGAKAADIQFFMQSNGFNTKILDLSTEEFLAEKGTNLDDIQDSILANAHSPEAVFALTSQYGLTPDMLAEIVGGGFKPHDVVGFFEDGGFNKEQLEKVSHGEHDTFIPFEKFGDDLPPLNFFPEGELIPLDEFIKLEGLIPPDNFAPPPDGSLPPPNDFEHPEGHLPPFPEDEFIKLDGAIPPDDKAPPPDDFVPPDDFTPPTDDFIAPPPDDVPPPPPPAEAFILI